MASITVDFPDPLLPLNRLTYSWNSMTLWLTPPQLFISILVNIFFACFNFCTSFRMFYIAL